MYIIFIMLVITFWVSLGMTEGFKWTNVPTFVTSKNYHIVRGFTNAAFLLMPIVAYLSFASFGSLFISTLLANICGWGLYEMALNYVNFGKFLHQKDDFVLGDHTFKHPPAIMIPFISTFAGIWYIIFNF